MSTTTTDGEPVSAKDVVFDAVDLEEGDEVELARVGYAWSNPLTVRDVEIVHWHTTEGGIQFTTTRVKLSTHYAGSEPHVVEAVSDEPPLWRQGGQEERLLQFEPVDDPSDDGDDEADVEPDGGAVAAEEQAAADFTQRVQSAASPTSFDSGARVTCENCGSDVSRNYADVFSPEDDPKSVRCCPACPDLVRENGEVREARSKRNTARMRSSGGGA